MFAIFLPSSRRGSARRCRPTRSPNLLTLSFVTGPISGTLFAAAAAWYRRFLALSSPRRRSGRARRGRTPAKGDPLEARRRPLSHAALGQPSRRMPA